MSLGTMMLACLRYAALRFFLLSVLECDVVAQTYVMSYREQMDTAFVKHIL